MLLGLTGDTCRTYTPSLPVQCSLLVGSPTVFSQGWFPGCKDWRCYLKVSACICLQSKERASHSPVPYLFGYSTAWHRATGPEFSAISLWGACRHRWDQGLPSSIHGQAQWEETSSAAYHLVSAHISVAPTCPWCGQAVRCGSRGQTPVVGDCSSLLGPDVLVVFLKPKWRVVRSGLPWPAGGVVGERGERAVTGHLGCAWGSLSHLGPKGGVSGVVPG